MSTCASQVLVQGPQCNVIEVITAGPQGLPGPSIGFSLSVSDTPSGMINDYAPTGYVPGVTNKLCLTPSAALTLTGIVAPTTDGFPLYLLNLSATFSISFSHETGSVVTNQFMCPSGVSLVLTPLTGAILVYDFTSGFWTFGGVG